MPRFVTDGMRLGARAMLSGALLVALAVEAPCGSPPDSAPQVRNPATPESGVETWSLREAWRFPSASADLLVGTVSQVLWWDEAFYLLDPQLSRVVVLSPAGELLRTVGGPGEGPGEVTRPRSMAVLPDGMLGLVHGFPGKVVKLTLAGEPAGQILLGAQKASSGRFCALHEVTHRGGTLAFCGWHGSQRGSVFERTLFLALGDEALRERHRLLEKPGQTDFNAPRYSEREEYFVNRGRWTIGPRGQVYTAPDRDRYLVRVYDRDGRVVREILREYAARRRSEAEIAALAEDHVAIVDGQRLQFEAEIEAVDACIVRLHVDEDAMLWVLSGNGIVAQPDGVFATYDLFDRSGRFVRQIRIACPGNAQRDRLVPLADGWFALVRGLDGDPGEVAEPAPEDEGAAAQVVGLRRR